jgi:exonuclease VII large subunit
MTKELLQQALDALLPHSSSHGNSWRAVEDAAIEALKQALAQQDQPDQQLCSFYQVDSFPALVAAQEQHIQKLQAKLAKPANPFHPLNSRAT